MPDENKASAATTDPFESVEVFRAGDYPGRGSFTESDLDSVVENYKNGDHEAPITIDHEQSGPAFGWVESLSRKDNILVAKLKPLADFAEQVKNGAFKKRSIELLRNPLRFRAVTFLGAGSPVVKGMLNVFKEENPAGTFTFAGETSEVLTFDTPMEDVVQFQETKRERGIDFPPRAFLFVPNVENPSTWKLRVWEDLEKKVTKTQLGRAASAFSPGGFRGRRVQLPRAQVRTIKRRLRALYRGLEVPDDQIPAQVRNFSVEIDGKEFFEEHFAKSKEHDAPNTWGIRLYKSPDDELPDEKLVGQAISFFSPGGFGSECKRRMPCDRGYFQTKQRITEACELIGKDQSWATITEDDIFWSEEFSVENLRKHRPDIIDQITTSFKEENQSSEEETIMSDELNEKVEQFKQENEALKSQAEEMKTALESKTVECSENTEELEALKKEQAISKNAEAVETAIGEAELSEASANELRAQFKDAENTEGLPERIEGMKAIEAQFATAGKDGVDDNEESNDNRDPRATFAARSRAYAKEHDIGIADAQREVELQDRS